MGMNQAQLRRLALAKMIIQGQANEYEHMMRLMNEYTEKERTNRKENLALPGRCEGIRLFTQICFGFWDKCISLYKRVCQFTVCKEKEARK